jgi:hypothetical protein
MKEGELRENMLPWQRMKLVAGTTKEIAIDRTPKAMRKLQDEGK